VTPTEAENSNSVARRAPGGLIAEIAIGLALVALTVVALGGVCSCEFVNYDDDIYVTNNLGVLQGISLEGIEWAFTATRSNHWHPLTWLSLQRDVDLYSDAGGLRAWGFHLTNLILHVGNVLLLYAALRWMTGYRMRSAIVAALFAVHPLHVESVAWVTERKDVLSTFFWLLTTLAYAGYARAPRWWRYPLVLGAFLLGLLAKPMLITLPFTLLLLDYWPLRRWPVGDRQVDERGPRFAPAGIGRLILEKIPLIAIAGASAAISLAARQLGGGIKSAEYLSFAERFGCAVNAAVMYIVKTFYPVGLAPFYPLPAGRWPLALSIAEAAVLVIVTTVALRQWRNRPYLLVGWLWYLGTLLPVSGLVQLGTYSYADRYTYVPAIGLFVAIVWLLSDLLPRVAGARAAIAAAAIVVLALLSARQVRTWRDSISLWEHARAVTADNFIARTHLGLAYESGGRYDEAESQFDAAIAMRPDLAVAWDKLGIINYRQGKLEDAETRFREALRREPRNLLYRQHLIEALKMQHKDPATVDPRPKTADNDSR
jgi:tetratricopeptide (TPR) repeat protein